MSDELIEGRSLRQKNAEPVADAPPEPPSRKPAREKPRETDEKSGPYATLAPPPEAGDVMRGQGEQATYHKKLQPVLIDEGKEGEAEADDAPDSTAPAADLPWDVIEAEPPVEEELTTPPAARTLPEPDSEPMMRLPKIESTPPEPEAPVKAVSEPISDDDDDDFVPSFHTPTGSVQPVSTDPDDFVPSLHTPTGVVPAAKDDPAPEEPVSKPSRRRKDATSGRLRPVESQDDEIAELYRKPEPEAKRERKPSAPRRVVDEPSGEIVDAEWVHDMDGRPANIDERIEAKLRERRSAEHRPVRAAPRVSTRTLLLVGGSILIILAAILIRLWPVLTGAPPSPDPSTPGAVGTVMEITTMPGAGSAEPGATLPLPTTDPSAEGYQQGRLAFSSNRDGNYELYVMAMASGNVTRLTNHEGADRFPAWSPNGTQIVFVSDAGQNDDLWLVPAGGGDVVRLTTDPGSDRNPTWSPDGTRIIFSREDIGGSRLLSLPTSCLSDAETCEGELTLLTPGGYDRFPSWSPDGSKLVFSASELPGGSSVVALLNPDGSGYAALAGTGTSDFGPAWSPDGTRLAFTSFARGDYDVWVMSSDGQGLVQYTNNQATDTSPAWSPDSLWLAFASDRGSQANFHLYVFKSDCTVGTACEDTLVQITGDTGIDDLDPAWAP